MKVRFNGEESDFLSLIGGGPQGTLIGKLEYLVLSNDNTDIVSPDDRYKYIDDLTLLQLVCLSGLLTEYNFREHVASDIGIGQSYLPADNYQTQDQLNFISNWSEEKIFSLWLYVVVVEEVEEEKLIPKKVRIDNPIPT